MMEEKPLFKWGGICALVSGILWIPCWVLYWMSQGGIPSQFPAVSEFGTMVAGGAFRAVIFLFGFNLFLFVVVNVILDCWLIFKLFHFCFKFGRELHQVICTFFDLRTVV